MKAIILAAGESKRLRPMTNNIPKCLLKIGGVTIIDRQIENLKKNGIKKIVVVVGYQALKLIGHLKKQWPDTDFSFIENENFRNTGAAYSLWLAKDYLYGSAIYLNADVFCHPDIVKNIVTSGKDSVTAIQRSPWNEEQVNMSVSDNLQIIEIGKHLGEESSYGEFIGVSKLGEEFNKVLIKALEHFARRGEHKKFAADAINMAIQKWGGKKYVLDVAGLPAIEIDTIRDYKNAKGLKI
ncbi:MAG: phosphocholine cytidylyltransferase family protein [bacterium]|nr:phosphocholine cytidylyltransferase family protein [bacterium]